MPNIKFGIDSAKTVGKTAGDFNNYDGPIPPNGIYRGHIKRLVMNKSKAGNYMFNILFEIKEPKGSPKAKYNGAACFSNQTITEKGAGFVNAFLHALAGTEARGRQLEKLFWSGGVQTAPDAKKSKDRNGNVVQHVIKIGNKFTIGAPGKVSIPVALQVKKGSYEGNERLEAVKWFQAKDDDDVDDDDVDDDDDTDVDEDVLDDTDDSDDDLDDDGDLDDDEDEDTDEDEDDDDDDLDGDDDDDLDEDEDEVEEQPVKKAGRKKPDAPF